MRYESRGPTVWRTNASGLGERLADAASPSDARVIVAELETLHKRKLGEPKPSCRCCDGCREAHYKYGQDHPCCGGCGS